MLYYFDWTDTLIWQEYLLFASIVGQNKDSALAPVCLVSNYLTLNGPNLSVFWLIETGPQINTEQHVFSTVRNAFWLRSVQNEDRSTNSIATGLWGSCTSHLPHVKTILLWIILAMTSQFESKLWQQQGALSLAVLQMKTIYYFHSVTVCLIDSSGLACVRSIELIVASGTQSLRPSLHWHLVIGG